MVSPEALFRELDGLIERGVELADLKVSANAHVIASYHATIDKVTERFLGKNQIGTTGRGIGPAYADKINRVGIRIADLFDEKHPAPEGRGRPRRAQPPAAPRSTTVARSRSTPSSRSCCPTSTGCGRWSATPRCCSTRRSTRGQTVLFEGAQATMLDVDHGTYPFVTSSNPVAGGVCIGAGIGPTRIDRVIGVIKAYTTRVGSGPFPTELFDEDGVNLQKLGGEIGVSTGRTRRCGWYDAVVARYASRVNGLTEFFLTKLDVLGAWDRIPVCVAYEIDGAARRRDADDPDRVPPREADLRVLRRLEEDISGCRSFDDLPKNAQVYVAGARGDLRRADLGRRRRTRARADGRRATA